MSKIKVACFGLQGFGNNLLQTLQNNYQVSITALYTRESSFSFKYYECNPIEELAEGIDIPVFYIPDKETWSCKEADLAIISSFHRMFKKEHLSNRAK